VAGFKPSFGLLSLEGVLPFAPSFDTAGLFTETADDMQLLWTRMGHAAAVTRSTIAVPSLMPAVEPVMEAAFRRAVERLERHCSVTVAEMPPGFPELTPSAKLIFAYEGARTHAAR
jgi:Asp-tRNA(Asn)/Glu-tRNA(Gln) amidotransferase A subunit family amidase